MTVLIILALIEVITFVVYGRKTYGQRLWNILIAIDQLGNAYGGGDPDETISSRASKQSHKRGWRALAWFLDKIDPGHTERAREADEGRKAAWGNDGPRHT